MKLPDFLLSGRFNALRDAMKAPLSPGFQRQSFFKPIDLPVIERLYQDGIDVEFDDIKILPDGTLSYRGYRVILYIRDVFNHGERSALPKYHLTHCRTLAYMHQNSRSNRYVVANRDDGYFSVNWLGDEKKSINSKLDICQNCLDGLKWKGFRNDINKSERLKKVANFNLKEFFTVYPRDLISLRPEHSSDTAPLNDYPVDWSIISEQVKANRGYICQSCKLGLTRAESKYLHVHHENGQRNDCRPSNLKVLCIRCHADEPMHSHMKRLPEYKTFMLRFSPRMD